MSSEPIPYFGENMPKDISVAMLSCAMVCDSASIELGRNPTAQETRDLFERVQKRIIDEMDESLKYHLDLEIKEQVEDMLKSKPYDPYHMDTRQLLSKKYCCECGNVQETQWEQVWYDNDPYDDCHSTCGPKKHMEIPRSRINPEYIQKHPVREICDNCHQQISSAVLMQ